MNLPIIQIRRLRHYPRAHSVVETELEPRQFEALEPLSLSITTLATPCHCRVLGFHIMDDT